MKRSLLLVLVCCMIVGSVMVGCNAVNDSSTSNDQQQDQVAEEEGSSEEALEPITLKFWQAGNDVVWHDYYLEAIEKYEAANPNITIEYAEAPWGNEIDTKVNAAFASGTAPDIMGHAIMSIAQRADIGQYYPLDEYLDQYEDLDDIVDFAKDAGVYNGNTYGICHYPVPSMYAYRKDYFEEAGLDPEDPPETWDELADAAVKLTKRDGDIVTRAGFNIPIDSFKIFIPFSWQNGAQNISDDLQPAFDNPEAVETLEFLTDLYREKKVAIEVTLQSENQLSLFSQGKAAMSWVEPSWIKKLITDDPSLKDKIGFMNIKKKQGGVWCGGVFLFMSADSEYKDEVWDFMKFLYGKDETWERYLKTGCTPIRKSLAEQFINDDPYMNSVISQTIENGVGAPRVQWAQLYLNKYIPLAQQEAFYGVKTPEQALKDNCDLLKEEIEQSK